MNFQLVKLMLAGTETMYIAIDHDFLLSNYQINSIILGQNLLKRKNENW